jgi:hypothetical protein
MGFEFCDLTQLLQSCELTTVRVVSQGCKANPGLD